mmetsp:Transcript_11890/g.29785  ORF Transcript_11890/g.29785 Transcript_11890/m.29785 type:complete len:146 (-) Transcript_11890:17-454(-)
MPPPSRWGPGSRGSVLANSSLQQPQVLPGQALDEDGTVVCAHCGGATKGAYHKALNCRKKEGDSQGAKTGTLGAPAGARGGARGGAREESQGACGGTPPRRQNYDDTVHALAAAMMQGGGSVCVQKDGRVFECDLTELSVNEDSE